jgi:4-hydroxybenzoyl-CoA reductase subunit beta
MLTLPRFEWITTRSVEETLAYLAEHPSDSLLVAGGTDAVPNMKHRLHEPRYVIHLGEVRELHFVREDATGLHIGPLVTLAELARDATVRRNFPSLAKAAGLIASPQIRNMGTVGGNLCLDTRCTYYNQTYFWREALGFCLKKSGTVCHVVPTGRKCVAAHSSDLSPVLISLGAEVEIDGRSGRRVMPVEDFFVADGAHNNVLVSGDLVTRITVPARSRGARCGYQKLRPRAAIDFPMLSVAFAARLGSAGCEWARLVVSALAAKPRIISGVNAILHDLALDEKAYEAVAEAAYKQCHPLINVPYDHEYRREMVPVYVRRALREALGAEAENPRRE